MSATIDSTFGLRRQYELLREKPLALDLTRGKPSEEQLALSESMLTYTGTRSRDGADCRNYGGIEGLAEARELFGAYLGASPENTLVLGNSSLAIMHDIVAQAMMRPLPGVSYSWGEGISFGVRPKMLCPVPGYDRHFAINERFGIEMIPIPMTDTGPDMRAVVSALRDNKWVVGMWCTPKYSNPTGVTYSEKTCRHLARLPRKYSDLRIIWDLAYNAHDLTETPDELPNMLELCREAGHEDRVFVVGSTSKMTFAGSGLAMLAASKANIAWFKQGLSVRTIGPDKLNQLRHVHFLRDLEGIRAHMAKHRAILVSKFAAVDEILTRELAGTQLARWSEPHGGYFVSLWVTQGSAKRVVQLAADVGVKLTPAGAAFPYGKDPEDSHIRIAPTYPALADVRQAMEVLTLCIKLAAAEAA